MLYLTHTWIKKLCLSGWCCSVCTAPRSTGWECSEKTCSFIRKWWSVKTKSVHEKKGNSEKSFWKKKNACKTKTSNWQNSQFKHLLNDEIKLILKCFFHFQVLIFLSTLKKKVQIKTQRFQIPETQYSHWGVLMPFSPLPNCTLIILETLTFHSGWENFPLFPPQNYFGMIKKASGFS